jgi:hypothetical protein
VPIVIARKRIYMTPAGGTLRVTKEEAAVLKALGLADDPLPVVAEPRKREYNVYKRRDLVAEAPVAPEPVPVPVPKPAPPAVPKPAAKPASKPKFTDED